MSGRACAARCQRRLAAGGHQHGVAGFVQRVVQHGQVVGHVVHDQHHVAVGAVQRAVQLQVGPSWWGWDWRRHRRGTCRQCRPMASNWNAGQLAHAATRRAVAGSRLRSRPAGSGCRGSSPAAPPPAAPPARRGSGQAARRAPSCGGAGGGGAAASQRRPSWRSSQSSSSLWRTGLRMKSSGRMPTSLSSPLSNALAETMATGACARPSMRRSGGSSPSRRCRAWPGPSGSRRAGSRRPAGPGSRGRWRRCAAQSPAAPAGAPAARGRPLRCPPPGCGGAGPS
jgi:hypothetical protein